MAYRNDELKTISTLRGSMIQFKIYDRCQHKSHRVVNKIALCEMQISLLSLIYFELHCRFDSEVTFEG
jgi:hypothetical protein